MMEPTTNFAHGLELARAELDRDGKLSNRDNRLITRLLEQPVMVGPNGRPIRALVRVHRRTRTLYNRLQKSFPLTLDWTKIVQWIKDNWLQIIRIILTVVPFII
jgi:hypothetical protein